MERAKRRHIQKCVKESSAEQIMNRLFKIFWDTVKEGHDPTAFSQKAWGSCTTYTAFFFCGARWCTTRQEVYGNHTSDAPHAINVRALWPSL